jgi:hypothetical protein
MKPKGNPLDFPCGQCVRFRPGKGTYGYEDCLDSDGRLSAIVVGHTTTRVRIELQGRHRRRHDRVAVDAASLTTDGLLVERERAK